MSRAASRERLRNLLGATMAGNVQALSSVTPETAAAAWLALVDEIFALVDAAERSATLLESIDAKLTPPQRLAGDAISGNRLIF